MDYNGENEAERNFAIADEKTQLTDEVLRMKVEQYVMAYGAEQDRLRALLPEGFVSLRPVLRINAESACGNAGATAGRSCTACPKNCVRRKTVLVRLVRPKRQ